MRSVVQRNNLNTEFYPQQAVRVITTVNIENEVLKRKQRLDCRTEFQSSGAKSVSDWITFMGYQIKYITEMECITAGDTLGSEAKLNT
ncbi:hypothetical protein [Flavobacterium sp.]|uniref:hypothetical protein n=1 Tax=Flavobacterium sp. TaxID=239 RepID=UPI002FDD69A1